MFIDLITIYPTDNIIYSIDHLHMIIYISSNKLNPDIVNLFQDRDYLRINLI